MKEGHLCAICDFKEQYTHTKTSLKLSKQLQTHTHYTSLQIRNDSKTQNI